MCDVWCGWCDGGVVWCGLCGVVVCGGAGCSDVVTCGGVGCMVCVEVVYDNISSHACVISAHLRLDLGPVLSVYLHAA